jgi:signal peptidase II
LKKELKIALFIFATIFIIDQVVKFGFASLGWGASGVIHFFMILS